MTMQVTFDPELMRRYDREGPRYTSYPTALQFHETVAADAYAAAAAASAGAAARAPLSLYVHIPFCRSPCFYCGCNKIVTRQMERADVYLARLHAEIALRGQYFDRGRGVEQLHFGGGTPTFLDADRLAALVATLGRHFRLLQGAERDYSIEIDPRTIDCGGLRTLSDLGFNRLSLGVQDYDAGVQSAINRFQSADMVGKLLGTARELGFRSLNFDLIYGLPRQTLATFARTLQTVIEQRPDRLAVYGYAHMPQMFKAQRRFAPGDLPDARTRLALLQTAVNTLTSAGYAYIGMDHFALPSDALAKAQHNGSMQRSFQGYTTHACRDLVSVGVSAIGQIGRLYIQNYKTMQHYAERIDQGRLPSHRGILMSDDDLLRRDVIQQIMCNGSIDIASTERRFGIEFDGYFAAELARLRTLQTDGLIALAERRIDLTPRGRLLMRNVAMVFDAYRNAGAGDARLSRVI
ncbi:MAG TPA: oxygen-independent coproporphyrinogen III oxidase [Steroidobacteraceae bacterium]|nr:oxygen-independent coproporphyrinogen III oxidase [Steroidobacteraceae bacterium]